ncbi:glycosyltransferase family 39 protein [Patescibacteria group bacterium]|nr:glycosyltransferase family 39 protein [Patescibacteria group bacterium]
MKIAFKCQEKLLLFFILILSAFLRLHRVQDYMTFLGDEGRDVLVVYNILHGKLTLLGPTASVGGFFLGPIYYYFMTPFLWLFNYDAVGPAIMVALFGVATVWLVYLVVKNIFNKKVALITAFLFSISPLVVTYSRTSWNPNLMPFFSLLSLFILYLGLVRKKAKFFIISGFLLGIAMQLHYLATFLSVVMFFQVLLFNLALLKKYNVLKSSLKQYLQIFIGFIIGWSPFIAFELRHNFLNIKSIFAFIFNSPDTGASGNFFIIIADVFYRLFSRIFVTEAYQLGSLPSFIFIGIGLFLVFLILLHIKSNINNKEKLLPSIFLINWLFFGILLFGFYKKPIYDYYLGFMFPLPFLIFGFALFHFWKTKLKYLFLTLILVSVILNLNNHPFKKPANRQYLQAKSISKFIYDKTEGKPFNFALITGGNSDHAYRYFFSVWKVPSVVIEEPVKDPNRSSATDQLFVVCESIPCLPLGNSLWEIAGFGRAEIAGEWDVSVVRVYKLIHYKEESK